METRRSIGGISKISAQEKAEASEKFAVFWHEECFMHRIKDHPEQPDRVSAILIALRKFYSDDRFRKAPLVTKDKILLFHTASHLQDLITLCDKSEKAYDENDDEELYQSIDGDTVVMWKTRRAVWRAAGSVVSAIDDLYLPSGNSRHIRYLFRKIT
jgi:acetoin utilization deacetylase AcuC-like enzyme